MDSKALVEQVHMKAQMMQERARIDPKEHFLFNILFIISAAHTMTIL
jgi:hypothetical protein